MSNTSDSERREYFRIDDEVYLDYAAISQQELNAAPEFLANLENNAFSLSADFATLNNNIHPVLNNITQLHPDIAQYLQFLNEKIDSLGQILLQKDNAFDSDKLINANLSASGIMFQSAQEIIANQAIKLEIILLPEKVGILIFAEVVKVDKSKDKNGWNICAEFKHIRDKDQELIIKHNLNIQMTSLRQKNKLD